MNKEKIIRIIKNIVAIVIMLAMFVIIFYQNRDRDLFKFGKTESSKIVSSSQENNESDVYSRCVVEKLGSKVAFLTPSAFSVLDKKGEGEENKVAFSKPIMYTDNEYAVIYDEEGKNVSVYKNDRLCYSIVTEEIIKATVNENGYMLLTTQKEGYSCECIAYNKNGEAIFKWDISKSEFLDGKINYSNNKIVLSVATAENDKLYGEIIVLDMTNAKVIKKHRYESQLFYGVEIYKNDTCATFSNSSLIFMNSDSEVKWTYDYQGKELMKADISESEMFLLVFLAEDSLVQSNSADVKIINRLGTVEEEKLFEGSLADVSVAETSIAFAIGKKVIITDGNLKEKKTLENDSGIKKIELYKDGKHVFVVSNTESKILK